MTLPNTPCERCSSSGRLVIHADGLTCSRPKVARVVVVPPQNHEAWKQQVSVPCPTCGAPAHAPCTREEHGRIIEIRGAHKARKAAANRA